MFAKFRLLAAVLLVTYPLLVHAAEITNLTITAMPGPNQAAYPTITSDTADAILSVASDCCRAVELHTHEMKGNAMRMRKVERVALPAGEPVVFASGGLHIMLIGPKKQLAEGDTVTLTFTFAKAAPQTVTFTARAPLHEDADSPSHHHHH